MAVKHDDNGKYHVSNYSPQTLGVSSMLIRREDSIASKSGMVLPFVPLAMSFENVNYYVEIPTVSTHISLIHPLMKS